MLVRIFKTMTLPKPHCSRQLRFAWSSASHTCWERFRFGFAAPSLRQAGHLFQHQHHSQGDCRFPDIAILRCFFQPFRHDLPGIPLPPLGRHMTHQ